MFTDWLVLRHARSSGSRLPGDGGLSSGLCQYRPPTRRRW
jgi:hypothetical protein